MSDTTVLKKIEELPPEARKEAQDFVDFLYEIHVDKKAENRSLTKTLLESPFFGMWKDREEMKDSSRWVREVRKSQWPD